VSDIGKTLSEILRRALEAETPRNRDYSNHLHPGPQPAPWLTGKTSPASITEDELVSLWARLLGRPAPRPKGRLFHALPVNRYPGPALQLARHEWFWSGERPGASVVDRNAGWGMWPDVAEFPYLMACHDGLWVPLYVGDPERLTWRRRKWWGRGPIIFAPHGAAHRRALALCDCFIAAAEGWPHADNCATRGSCR
jgi:hypothetical protein